MRALLVLASIAMLVSAEPPTGYSHRSSNPDLNFQPVPSVAQIHIPPSSQTSSRQYLMPSGYSIFEKEYAGPQLVSYSPSHFSSRSLSSRSDTTAAAETTNTQQQSSASSNTHQQYSPAPQQYAASQQSYATVTPLSQYLLASSSQQQSQYAAPSISSQQYPQSSASSQQQQTYSAPSQQQQQSYSQQQYAAPSQQYSASSSPSSQQQQSYAPPSQQQYQQQYSSPPQQYSSPTNVQVAYGQPQLPAGALGYGPPPIVSGAGPDHNVEYRVVYVKGPKAQKPDLILPPPPPKQKTLVYILVPKVEPPEPIIVPTHAPTPPSKPEVFFIRYKAAPKKARQQPQQQLYSSYGSPVGAASAESTVTVEAPPTITDIPKTKILVRKSISSKSSFGDKVSSSESS